MPAEKTRARPREADCPTDFTQGCLEIQKMGELNNWTVLSGRERCAQEASEETRFLAGMHTSTAIPPGGPSGT